MEDIVGSPIGLGLYPGAYISIAHGQKEMGGDMRFQCFIFENPLYRIIEIAVRHPDIDRSAYGILITKHFLSNLFRDNDAVGSIESRQGVTIAKMICKHPEKSGIDIKAIGLIKLLALITPGVRQQHFVKRREFEEPRGVGYFRHVRLQPPGHRRGGGRPSLFFFPGCRLSGGGDAVYQTRIFILGVIPPFAEDIGHDEQTGGEADRQAENINEGEYFVPDKIPVGDLQICSKHGGKKSKNMPIVYSGVFQLFKNLLGGMERADVIQMV